MTFAHTAVVLNMLKKGVRPTRIATLCGCDVSLVYVIRNRGESRLSATRALPVAIERRRKLVAKLAKIECRKGNRRWPMYPSAAAIARELFARASQAPNGKPWSVSTITRDLHESGLKCYVRPKVPSVENVPAQRRFGRKYVIFRARDFVFSDEHFITGNDHGVVSMWHEKRSLVCPREQKRRTNTFSFMVWAAIGWNFRTELVIFPKWQKDEETGGRKAWTMTGEKYKRLCLPLVVPHVKAHNLTFMHDGATPHHKKCVGTYLANKGIRVIEDWVSHTPQLNPIEDVWAELNKRISALCPMNGEELKAAAKKAWADIPVETMNRYVLSFKTKCAAAAAL